MVNSGVKIIPPSQVGVYMGPHGIQIPTFHRPGKLESWVLKRVGYNWFQVDIIGESPAAPRSEPTIVYSRGGILMPIEEVKHLRAKFDAMVTPKHNEDHAVSYGKVEKDFLPKARGVAWPWERVAKGE